MLLPRQVCTRQPPQGSRDSLPVGLRRIASYLPFGYSDVDGLPMTRGSAAAFSVTGAGRALKQTGVNTAIYRTITGLPTGQDKYIAVWSGVVVGGPTSTTPKLLGISTTATSQSADYLGIERGTTSADHVQVTCKSNTSAVIREFNVGLASLYGKQITLVGVFAVSEGLVRLHMYADGKLTSYSSTVLTAIAPAVLGTERFVVGVDIIEVPTRSANVHCNLAAMFAGACALAYELEVAKNPWQIFAPRTRYLFSVTALANIISLGLVSAQFSAQAHQASADSALGIGSTGAGAYSVSPAGVLTASTASVPVTPQAAFVSAVQSLQSASTSLNSPDLDYILGALGNAVNLGLASINGTARAITYSTPGGTVHVVPYEFLGDYDIVHYSGSIAVDRAGALIIVLR